MNQRILLFCLMRTPRGISFSSFPQFLCFFPPHHPLLGAIVPHFFPLPSFLPKSFPHFISFIYMKYSFLCILPAPFFIQLRTLPLIFQPSLKHIYLLTHISQACRASTILINQLKYQLFIHLNGSQACMTSIDSTLP